MFRALFGARDDYGLAQQNIQARIRGAILMAVSNAESRLVLATGNKSELSVGYCTLYGDTVGGLAVLGDVYKRDVYALARRANAHGRRADSRAQHREAAVRGARAGPARQRRPARLPRARRDPRAGDRGRARRRGDRAAAGRRRASWSSASVARLDRNEYKRRQTPLVLRTSTKAFGSGRRLPIVHRYRDAGYARLVATPSAPTARTFSARGPRGPSCTTYSTMSPSESAS